MCLNNNRLIKNQKKNVNSNNYKHVYDWSINVKSKNTERVNETNYRINRYNNYDIIS